jgi:DNA-binding NarL/FixJ family response regulator
MVLDIDKGMTKARAIIFVPEDAESPGGLQDMVDSISPFATSEVVRSFGDLNKQLLPRANQLRPIVIVVAPTRDDLESLLEIYELFENTRLILVLADADAETVALGHRMQPRFIGYLANSFTEIAAVVRKMAGGSRLTDQCLGGKGHDFNERKRCR